MSRRNSLLKNSPPPFKQVIRILDLTPIGYFADGSPQYRFRSSLPTRGISTPGNIAPLPTPEVAFALGSKFVNEFQCKNPLSNMGEVLGVTKVDNGYLPVINTYNSNS